VPEGEDEAARARLLALRPEGFEERAVGSALELVAYVDGAGEAAIRREFDAVSAEPVAACWEDAWRRFHRAARVGPLWIGPPWLEPDPDTISVVIEPAQAFGTGAHPTTRLCLELLLDEVRTSVLDVGCGSGVLSVAAARLGFSPVVAVDREAAAVDATRRNAALNAVVLEVGLADATTDELPPAALALANLEASLIGSVAGRLRCGRLVSSGYLAGDRPALPGWDRLDRRELEGWAAELHQRSPS
jgi:ribosomal protein L11 methyltransferase